MPNCPNCKSVPLTQEPNSWKCGKCGKEFARKVTTSTATSSSGGSESKNCIKCKLPLKGNINFCTGCGTKQNEPPQSTNTSNTTPSSHEKLPPCPSCKKIVIIFDEKAYQCVPCNKKYARKQPSTSSTPSSQPSTSSTEKRTTTVSRSSRSPSISNKTSSSPSSNTSTTSRTTTISSNPQSNTTLSSNITPSTGEKLPPCPSCKKVVIIFDEKAYKCVPCNKKYARKQPSTSSTPSSQPTSTPPSQTNTSTSSTTPTSRTTRTNSTVSRTTTISDTGDKKQCGKCSYSLKLNATFCPSCGSKVDSDGKVVATNTPSTSSQTNTTSSSNTTPSTGEKLPPCPSCKKVVIIFDEKAYKCVPCNKKYARKQPTTSSTPSSQPTSTPPSQTNTPTSSEKRTTTVSRSSRSPSISNKTSSSPSSNTSTTSRTTTISSNTTPSPNTTPSTGEKLPPCPSCKKVVIIFDEKAYKCVPCNKKYARKQPTTSSTPSSQPTSTPPSQTNTSTTPTSRTTRTNSTVSRDSSVNDTGERKQCGKCSYSLKLNATFCPSCGSKVDSEGRVSTVVTTPKTTPTTTTTEKMPPCPKCKQTVSIFDEKAYQCVPCKKKYARKQPVTSTPTSTQQPSSTPTSQKTETSNNTSATKNGSSSTQTKTSTVEEKMPPCPKCKKTVSIFSETAYQCVPCKKKYARKPPPTSTPTQQPPPTTTSVPLQGGDGKNTCIKCNRALKTGATFCASCGSRQTQVMVDPNRVSVTPTPTNQTSTTTPTTPTATTTEKMPPCPKCKKTVIIFDEKAYQCVPCKKKYARKQPAKPQPTQQQEPPPQQPTTTNDTPSSPSYDTSSPTVEGTENNANSNGSLPFSQPFSPEGGKEDLPFQMPGEGIVPPSDDVVSPPGGEMPSMEPTSGPSVDPVDPFKPVEGMDAIAELLMVCDILGADDGNASAFFSTGQEDLDQDINEVNQLLDFIEGGGIPVLFQGTGN